MHGTRLGFLATPKWRDTDRQRVEFRFALYERLAASLVPPTGKPKDGRVKQYNVKFCEGEGEG